ncbi:MAG: helix-hairpin-helix domain-containing protein [Lachnospiraceae bacterium]|nr:helix-hairpin-helix domain-containing protein [Lachnospiraceae bacterium]
MRDKIYKWFLPWGLVIICFLGLFCGCGKEQAVYEIQADSQTEVQTKPEAKTDTKNNAITEAETKTETKTETETKSEVNAEQQTEENSSETLTEKTTDQIAAYICGAVNSPGVYELSKGSRVCELIAMAGGLREDAEDRLVNQAAPVTDGMQIVVYTREESAGMQVPTEDTSQKIGLENTKVNINTADREELMTLTGIGGTRADAILAYRSENGIFDSIEAIMKVEGIKEKLFEKIKDQIEV